MSVLTYQVHNNIHYIILSVVRTCLRARKRVYNFSVDSINVIDEAVIYKTIDCEAHKTGSKASYQSHAAQIENYPLVIGFIADTARCTQR